MVSVLNEKWGEKCVSAKQRTNEKTLMSWSNELEQVEGCLEKPEQTSFQHQ